MIPRLHPGILTLPLAHRALHDVTDGRPENSLSAIEAAIAHGYGVEIDLQLSADGQAMVFHDDALDRLAEGAGPVRARTAEDLGQITLLGGAEGVPTLRAVLDFVAGRVPLLIEIKDQDGAMGPNIGALEKAAVADLTGYTGPFGLMSFNPHSVAFMAELMPHAPRGLVSSSYDPAKWHPLPAAVCDALRPIADFERTKSSFISHEVADLSNPRVAELKNAGADVLCWTVKTADEERIARDVAQNITFEGYLAQHGS